MDELIVRTTPYRLFVLLTEALSSTTLRTLPQNLRCVCKDRYEMITMKISDFLMFHTFESILSYNAHCTAVIKHTDLCSDLPVLAKTH